MDVRYSVNREPLSALQEAVFLCIKWIFRDNSRRGGFKRLCNNSEIETLYIDNILWRLALLLPHFGKAHSLMIRIVSDTSTMYSTKQAREAGFAVSPLAVTIAGRSGRELDEMSPDDFVSIIAKGHMPKKTHNPQ